MRGKTSLVFVLLCVLVLLTGTLTSLAAYCPWSTQDLPGCRLQTLAIDPAALYFLYPGTDIGPFLAPDGWGQQSADSVATLRLLLAENSA